MPYINLHLAYLICNDVLQKISAEVRIRNFLEWDFLQYMALSMHHKIPTSERNKECQNTCCKGSPEDWATLCFLRALFDSRNRCFAWCLLYTSSELNSIWHREHSNTSFGVELWISDSEADRVSTSETGVLTEGSAMDILPRTSDSDGGDGSTSASNDVTEDCSANVLSDSDTGISVEFTVAAFPTEGSLSNRDLSSAILADFLPLGDGRHFITDSK